MEGISNLTIKSKESEIKNTKIKTKEFRSIVLKFRGDLKKSMNFINHITWAAGYLTLNTLTIMEGDLYPNYMAVLNIQYLDPNQRNDFELLVDLDSEILLKKVYNNPPERHRKKELAPQF